MAPLHGDLTFVKILLTWASFPIPLKVFASEA